MGAFEDSVGRGRFSRMEGLPREVSTPLLEELGIKVADTTGAYSYRIFMSDVPEGACIMGTITRNSKPGVPAEGQSSRDAEPELFDTVTVFGGQANDNRTIVSQEIAPPLETEAQRLEALGRLVVVASETLGLIVLE